LPRARRVPRLPPVRCDDGPASLDPVGAHRSLAAAPRPTEGGVTALFDLIAKRIRRRGPLSVAEYMELALGHPKYGYYRTRDPLGRAGDFITAPEISQIFGELLGLWCADTWQKMGEPDPVLLVELGPGRGTLMKDALRAAAIRPAFRQALRVHLIETSPVLPGAPRHAP